MVRVHLLHLQGAPLVLPDQLDLLLQLHEDLQLLQVREGQEWLEDVTIYHQFTSVILSTGQFQSPHTQDTRYVQVFLLIASFLSCLQPLRAVRPPVSWVKVQFLMAPLRPQLVVVQISKMTQVLEEQGRQEAPHTQRVAPNQGPPPQPLWPRQLQESHQWPTDLYHQGKRPAVLYANMLRVLFTTWFLFPLVLIKNSKLVLFVQVGAEGGPEWENLLCWSHREKDDLGQAWAPAYRVLKPSTPFIHTLSNDMFATLYNYIVSVSEIRHNSNLNYWFF